jgi:hypothetical protein
MPLTNNEKFAAYRERLTAAGGKQVPLYMAADTAAHLETLRARWKLGSVREVVARALSESVNKPTPKS